MTPTLLMEAGNQHALRKYPFTDDASLISTKGVQLPVDFLLDAYLYPIDAVGPIYVSQISLATGTMTFYDAGADAVCGQAQWSAGETSAAVVDMSGYEREIGMIVINPAAAVSGATLDFLAPATTLDPACAVPLLQRGVRGILAGVPANLVTGTVVFEGRNGVRVKTYVNDAGLNIIRIDIIGEEAPAEDDCDSLGPPITSIIAINEPCTPLVATNPSPGVIAIAGAPGFTADGLCPSPRLPGADGALPVEKDSCAPGTPPTPFECPPDSMVAVEVVDGQLHITAPSSLAAGNPVRVQTELLPGETVSLAGRPGRENIDELTERIDRVMRHSSLETGRITIGLRGRL